MNWIMFYKSSPVGREWKRTVCPMKSVEVEMLKGPQEMPSWIRERVPQAGTDGLLVNS